MIQLTVSQTALSDVQGGALSKISCLLDKMLAGTRAGSDKHSSKTTIVSNCQARKRERKKIKMVKNSGVRHIMKGALEGRWGEGRVASALGTMFWGTGVGFDGHSSTAGMMGEV